MGEEIAYKNGWISDFQWLMTLTLDWVILHTVMHHSSTSTYIPNLTEIKETVCGWTDVPMDGRTDGQTFETHFVKSTQRSWPKNPVLKHVHAISVCKLKTNFSPAVTVTYGITCRMTGSSVVVTLWKMRLIRCNRFSFFVVTLSYCLS